MTKPLTPSEVDFNRWMNETAKRDEARASIAEHAQVWAERLADLATQANASAEVARDAALMPVMLEILEGKTRWGHVYSHQSRRGAVIVLRGAQGAIDTLVKLLSDADEIIRMEAATAIGAIGPPAQVAVPALAHGLLVTGTVASLAARNFAGEAAAALGKIGGPAAVAALVDTFSDDKRHRFDRAAAVDALAHLGPEARTAVPALERVAGHSDVLREHALQALEAIG